MINLNNIAERLFVEIPEIESIIYRNEDLGIGGRCFKHIDVEMIFGDYIELIESDMLYQEIYEQSGLSELENGEEVILFQRQEN